MPLPPEQDQRIRSRFEELIEEANGISTNSGYEAFLVKSQSLIRKVLGSSERGGEIEKRIMRYSDELKAEVALEYITGTLQGLKNDYENGFLDNLEEQVVANISSDYMAQVEEILTARRSGEYDHAFAAVMCGAVLEDALRRLCDRQSEPIATVKDNGQPKRLDALISDLKKGNVFNALKADQLRAWSKTRNHAAHGELSEFNRNDVEQMVNGVKHFLADYL